MLLSLSLRKLCLVAPFSKATPILPPSAVAAVQRPLPPMSTATTIKSTRAIVEPSRGARLPTLPTPTVPIKPRRASSASALVDKSSIPTFKLQQRTLPPLPTQVSPKLQLNPKPCPPPIAPKALRLNTTPMTKPVPPPVAPKPAKASVLTSSTAPSPQAKPVPPPVAPKPAKSLTLPSVPLPPLEPTTSATTAPATAISVDAVESEPVIKPSAREVFQRLERSQVKPTTTKRAAVNDVISSQPAKRPRRTAAEQTSTTASIDYEQQWSTLMDENAKAHQVYKVCMAIRSRLTGPVTIANMLELAIKETNNRYITCQKLKKMQAAGALFGIAAPVAQAKRIVITGAGPMGLMAAIVLTLQGHNVLILEKRALTKAFTRCNSLHLWEPTRRLLKDLGISPAKLHTEVSQRPHVAFLFVHFCHQFQC
eukprot:TRINITY_DN12658_c0_g3_i11.p1 TRINITY_DN12658_c0_g3~~TRINITY_DN12658_c0_g3_i11.p1  ORF type:complete len:424 (-),score=104.69 TRINITY_DN12658_c0_g3_i11:3047-4318(-)